MLAWPVEPCIPTGFAVKYLKRTAADGLWGRLWVTRDTRAPRRRLERPGYGHRRPRPMTAGGLGRLRAAEYGARCTPSLGGAGYTASAGPAK